MRQRKKPLIQSLSRQKQWHAQKEWKWKREKTHSLNHKTQARANTTIPNFSAQYNHNWNENTAAARKKCHHQSVKNNNGKNKLELCRDNVGKKS